jgi:S1-C subfamily serine protease
VREALAVAGAAIALVAAGCNLGDDEDGGGGSDSASTTREVTTTRVEVVEGIGEEGGFDPAAIYERLSPGVVTVISLFDGPMSVLEDGGEGGQGSGFVLDDQGYIATNAHVVTKEDDNSEKAERVFVQFPDGNRVPAEIVGDDPNADVALLKVEPSGLDLTPLRLGRSEGLDVGSPVAAIGSPFGEEQSLSVGVVSALDRNIQSLTRFGIGDAIQTDAAINPGNSGGPLLDARGRVIGVNAQIKSQSGGGEGVGFAIPVDTVRRSLSELRDDGRVEYGYLGVQTVILWPQLAQRLGIDAEAGALVQGVEPGSPAEEKGLDPGDETIDFQGQPDIPADGDVIVAVDGKPLTRTEDLSDVIGGHGEGDRVVLTVVREGERRRVAITLGRRPLGSGP